MRSSNKSRSRNKNSNRSRSVGNVVNRVFDSAGPEGKVRGTPQQIIDKYQTLARDAQLSNDRVATENFLQHAEHYTRMLNEAQREQAERQASEQQRQQANGAQNGAANGAANGSGPQPQPTEQPRSSASAEDETQRQDQPAENGMAAIDVAEAEPTGLVETPETTGRRNGRSRPRTRRSATADDSSTSAPAANGGGEAKADEAVSTAETSTDPTTD